jgi:hypothetical protein
MSIFAELALLAYACCNALRVFSYIPQIVRIARDCEGAKAISLATWGLWVAANGSTVLYAWINLGDVPLALLNGFNTFACVIVMALTVWKRRLSSNTGAQASFASSAASFSGRLAE